MLEQLRHLAAGTTGGAFLFRPQGRLKEWEMVGYGLYGRTVTSLVADQRGGVFLAIERGMLRYTEDWSDWKPLYQGLPYPDVYSIALDHRTERLYAGTAPAAVFNSVNRGKEWFPSGETSALSSRNGWTNPEPPHRPRLIRLIAHPTLENTLIGGVQAGGVIVSRDGGRTWSNHKAGLSRQLTDLRLHPERPDRLYATNFLGFYRSDDLGSSWQLSNHGLPYFEAQAVCVHGVDPDRLLLAVNHPLEPSSILFSSKDGGRNWQVACSELPVSEAGRVTCLESGGGAFFAGTENGIILGSRDGSQWELVRAELPPIRTLLWVGEVPGKTRLPLL
jgi:photosystem II stability/assembly factor-like uncharacterized protein